MVTGVCAGESFREGVGAMQVREKRAGSEQLLAELVMAAGGRHPVPPSVGFEDSDDDNILGF